MPLSNSGKRLKTLRNSSRNHKKLLDRLLARPGSQAGQRLKAELAPHRSRDCLATRRKLFNQFFVNCDIPFPARRSLRLFPAD